MTLKSFRTLSIKSFYRYKTYRNPNGGKTSHPRSGRRWPIIHRRMVFKLTEFSRPELESQLSETDRNFATIRSSDSSKNFDRIRHHLIIGSFDQGRISVKELKLVYDNLRNTAVGHDDVQNKSLKRYAKLFILQLLVLYNTSFALGYVSPAWKLAHIILMHKPDKDA